MRVCEVNEKHGWFSLLFSPFKFLCPRARGIETPKHVCLVFFSIFSIEITNTSIVYSVHYIYFFSIAPLVSFDIFICFSFACLFAFAMFSFLSVCFAIHFGLFLFLVVAVVVCVLIPFIVFLYDSFGTSYSESGIMWLYSLAHSL